MTKVAQHADGPIPAVRYGAKSSPDPRHSVPSQHADTQAAIEREGGRILYGEAQADVNKSAFSGNRGEGLTEAKRLALAAQDEHGAAELWVQHSDRLARGAGDVEGAPDHLLEVIFWARRHGVTLRSVQDPETFTNLLNAAMMGERNFEDSRRKSEAVRSGKRRQFDRGEHLGGPTLDGYRLVDMIDPSGRAVKAREIDPERASTWVRAFELADGGMAPANIARRLWAEGYRTKAGSRLSRRRVQDGLSNPSYAGRIARNRTKPGEPVEWTQGRHPALVDPERFDRIQALVASRDRAAGSDRRPGRPHSRHALAGLAYCMRCETKMRTQVSTYRRVRDGGQARHYVCQHVYDATGLCDQPRIDAEVVDRAIVAHLKGFFVDFDGWVRAVTAARADERSALQRSLDSERERLTKLKRRETSLRERWLDAMEADDERREAITYEAMESVVQDRAEVGDRVTELENRLASLSEPEPVDGLLDFYNSLSAAVRGRLDAAGTLAEVNAELAELFQSFSLDTAEEGVRVIPVLRPDAVRFITFDNAEERVGRLWGIGDTDPEPIPTLVSGDERIVPPVEHLEVPRAELTDAQA